MRKPEYLLLEDVYKLGRKGDLITAKPGYIRNFLLPKGKAVMADATTLKIRARLQEERAKQAAVDKKEAEELSKIISDKVISTEVKVDSDGHMYGSVAAKDIVAILSDHGIAVEKDNVQLPKPLKKIGTYSIALRLKEGVPATFTLNIGGEGYTPPQKKEEAAEGDAESHSPSTR